MLVKQAHVQLSKAAMWLNKKVAEAALLIMDLKVFPKAYMVVGPGPRCDEKKIKNGGKAELLQSTTEATEKAWEAHWKEYEQAGFFDRVGDGEFLLQTGAGAKLMAKAQAQSQSKVKFIAAIARMIKRALVNMVKRLLEKHLPNIRGFPAKCLLQHPAPPPPPAERDSVIDPNYWDFGEANAPCMIKSGPPRISARAVRRRVDHGRRRCLIPQWGIAWPGKHQQCPLCEDSPCVGVQYPRGQRGAHRARQLPGWAGFRALEHH